VTQDVLAALSAAHAQVTVFAVGSWLDADPRMARLILDAGHELGNHTYHHLPMRALTPAEADAEVARAAAVLTRLTGGPGAWFRPSGTPMSTPVIRAAARRSGYRVCVSYDVDSLDWTDPGARTVVTNVITRVHPGSIVSLHLGHAGTAAALPGLLVGLAQRGLRPVTVSRLLA
jgi:peptidoglycan/xylan/chitin deacetylase (PgdA/CDA1 family)